MKMHMAVVGFTMLASAASLSADTLVLRDGRRIQGELLGVFGREIEFEERTSVGRRSIRVPRVDIARIEFEDDRSSFGGSRDDARQITGIPRGMRERRVNVTAREPWTDTGIDVRAGQEIYLMSDGEIRWGPNRRDGVAGERNSPSNAGRPLPDRPAAALIARIGERNDIFFIGDDPGPFRVRSSGRLFLGVNDDVFTDNTGNFRVTVSY